MPVRPVVKCAVEGCERPAEAGRRGLCNNHYMRWWRGTDRAAKAPRGGAPAPNVRTRLTGDDYAVLRWYSERLREDRLCFLRGEDPAGDGPSS